ncbi:MAG: helix-turn-helix transcriptional regulator [Desulfamplus sp.]|nr:helix-turn-helix transcriptional regulator [Desulfamplus sp.]
MSKETFEKIMYSQDFDVVVVTQEEIQKQLVKHEYQEEPVQIFHSALGYNIKRLREKSGLSHKDLADLLSSSSYNLIEDGQLGVTKNNLLDLCKLFNVSIDELFSDVTNDKEEDAFLEKKWESKEQMATRIAELEKEVQKYKKKLLDQKKAELKCKYKNEVHARESEAKNPKEASLLRELFDLILH